MAVVKKAVLIGLIFSATVANAQLPRPLDRSQPGINPGPTLSYQAASRIVVAGSSPSNALYQTPKGTGYDGVGSIFIQRSDGNFLCSGALIAGGAYMLTAAHCLADATGKLITQQTTSVFFPPGGPSTAREFITSTQFFVNPLYSGEVIDAHDIAVIKLGSTPSALVTAAAYSLFRGNPFGRNAELVGSGAAGTGATGSTISGGFTLADRRRGNNTIDFTWTDSRFGGFFLPQNGNFFGKADPYGLVGDFDSGLARNDASCAIGSAFGVSAFCSLGLGLNEAILGPGDSGGPLFINGQIAGVASYGLSFGSGFGDSDDALNDTFGEFSGWASTGYNDPFLNQFVAPEPSSIALIAIGLFAITAVTRRRAA